MLSNVSMFSFNSTFSCVSNDFIPLDFPIPSNILTITNVVFIHCNILKHSND